MTKKDKSFVTEDMEKFESDLIYEIHYKNQPFYIYLLMEFQSTVDLKMPIRFLRYILELCEDNGINPVTGLYPTISPLLLYNGENKWTAATNILDVFEKTIPRDFIPDFCYYPIIINEIPKETLLKIHNVVSGIFFIENTDIENLYEGVQDLITILKDVPGNRMDTFKNWLNNLFARYNLDVPEQVLHTLTTSKEVLPMFTALLERYISETREKGKEEGLLLGIYKEKREIALNLLHSGSDLEFIAKMTGFTVEELKGLK